MSFLNYLEGKRRRWRNLAEKGIKPTREEIRVLIEEIIKEYKKAHIKEIVVEPIGFVRDGHTYNIYRGFDNDYRIWIYGDESPTIIEKDKINFLYKVILEMRIGVIYKARYFFQKIINEYGLDVDIEAFAGGRYRAKLYMPLYLYPAKVIEKETDMIKVVIGKGGGILRLK